MKVKSGRHELDARAETSLLIDQSPGGLSGKIDFKKS
jgi:hypothetical protein